MKKEGWPEFPFNYWDSVAKWDMTRLRDIGCHLEQHTRQQRIISSSGYRGIPSTDMEKQLFEHVGALSQQVGELEDVVQALLQIIDDNRLSEKVRRARRWMAERVRICKETLQESTLFLILSLIGVLATVYGIAKGVIYFLR